MKRIQRTRHLTEAEAAALRETCRQVEAEFAPLNALEVLRELLAWEKTVGGWDAPAWHRAKAVVARGGGTDAGNPAPDLVKTLADALQFLAAVIETAEAEDPDDASTHALVVNHGLAVLHNGVEALRAAGVEFEALKDEPVSN